VLFSTTVVELGGFLFAEPLVEDRLVAREEREMRALGGVAAAAIDRGEDPRAVAYRLGGRAGARVEILDRRGATLGDTLGDRRISPEVDASLAELPEDPELVVTVEGASGVRVRVTRSLAGVRAVRATLRELMVVGGGLAVLLAAFLTLILSRTIVEPMQELTQVARALAAGDLSARSRSERRDEIGTLGRTLDLMAEQLRERIGAVRVEEARLRTVLDGMVEAVFVTDRTGRIILHNEALARLVGHEVQGRTAVEAIRSAELLESVWAGLDGQEKEVEVQVRVGDDERHLAVQVAPLPERAGVVAVVHDVTALKQTDRVRRDFVANASHELRTPLTAIRGYAETLRDGGLGDPEMAQRFLDTILRHTRRLQRLVDDLLALSRAESPDEPLPMGPVDVVEAARDVVRGLQGQADAREIDLALEAPEGLPPVRSNDWAVDQILVNLVDNALKYCPSGSRVRVRIRTVGEGTVTLDVVDDGPGIPGGELERIFERFYRVEKGRSRQVGGTGLGLSIVKHLAQRLDVAIDVDSTVDKGTTFRLRFPRTPATETASPAA
jgi:two-component system phosphate regulon sensor histidine kinase PhoR